MRHVTILLEEKLRKDLLKHETYLSTSSRVSKLQTRRVQSRPEDMSSGPKGNTASDITASSCPTKTICKCHASFQILTAIKTQTWNQTDLFWNSRSLSALRAVPLVWWNSSVIRMANKKVIVFILELYKGRQWWRWQCKLCSLVRWGGTGQGVHNQFVIAWLIKTMAQNYRLTWAILGCCHQILERIEEQQRRDASNVQLPSHLQNISFVQIYHLQNEHRLSRTPANSTPQKSADASLLCSGRVNFFFFGGVVVSLSSPRAMTARCLI